MTRPATPSLDALEAETAALRSYIDGLESSATSPAAPSGDQVVAAIDTLDFGKCLEALRHLAQRVQPAAAEISDDVLASKGTTRAQVDAMAGNIFSVLTGVLPPA